MLDRWRPGPGPQLHETRTPMPPIPTTGRPAWLLAGLGCALLACTPSKRGDTAAGAPDELDAPDEPGPWVVGHGVDTLADIGEPGRTLPIDLWYPVTPGEESGSAPTEYLLQGVFALPSPLAHEDAPGAGLDAPLLVFSHGYRSIHTQSTALMEALASHGFVVVSVGHSGNTQDDPSDDFETAASRRVPDIAAVIDWASTGAGGTRLAGQVDAETVGVLGHSFGGMTTLGVGAGWAGAGALPVVDALMPISAVVDADLQEDDRPSESAGFSAADLATITQPTLLLGGTRDTNVPVENNGLAFGWMTGAESVVRVDIIGATHTHFANVCDIGELLIGLGLDMDAWEGLGAGDLVAPYTTTCTGDAFPIEEAVRLQNLYAVAHFRRHLRGEEGYAAWLEEDGAAGEAAVELWVR